MSNFKGKRMVEEDLIKKLEDLDPSGGEYTAGTGIEISAENEISIDTDTVATKSELFSGSYNDLTNKPDLSIYAESSDLATVATTGAYSDLTGTPTIPEAPLVLTQTSGTLSDEDYAKLDENTVIQYMDTNDVTRLYYFKDETDTRFEYITNPIFTNSLSGQKYLIYITKADKSYNLNITQGASLLPYPSDNGTFRLISSRSGSTVSGPNWKLDYPDPDTSAAGSFNLEATVDAQGGVTYDWAAGGSGSSYTFTNGLTESSGTVSWDLNNIIKSVDNSANGLGLRLSTDGNFGAIIGEYSSSSTPTTTGSGYGIQATNSLIVAQASGTKPNFSASNCALLLAKDNGYNGNNAMAGGGSIVSANFNTTYGYISSLNHSIVFGKVDSNSGDMKSTGNECLLVGRGLQSASNYQTVIGQDNIKDSNNQYAFIIGNGTDKDNRSNAMTVDWDGVIVSKNLPAVSGTDGTYQLTATTSSGTTTYSWAAGGSGGKYLHRIKIYANFSGLRYWTEDFISSSPTAYTSVSDYLTDRGYTITGSSDQPAKSLDTYAGSSIEAIAYRDTYGIYISQINISNSGVVSYDNWSLQSNTPSIQDEVIAL